MFGCRKYIEFKFVKHIFDNIMYKKPKRSFMYLQNGGRFKFFI